MGHMTERDKERGGDEGVLAPSISLTELLRRENETIFDGVLFIFRDGSYLMRLCRIIT